MRDPLSQVGSKSDAKKVGRKGGKKSRKIGRKHRNGKPFGMNGGCGCITCRRQGRR